jgi:hypothetical protein
VATAQRGRLAVPEAGAAGSGRKPLVYEYERPWMYDAQEYHLFHPARTVVIEASTKTGKTVGCIVWLHEEALQGKPGHNYWWVAPTHGTADIAYRRLRQYLAGVSDVYRFNDSRHTITTPAGTVIWFKSAEKPDLLYGEDVYGVVIDEATRCKEAAWIAIRSTMTATRGRLRIIGNVRGSKNWAYQAARRAELGGPGRHYARLTILDAVRAGLVPLDEIEASREDIPTDQWLELYMAIPAEDGGNPFGLRDIRAITMPPGMYAALQREVEPVCWGIDLGKRRSWTVLLGLDAQMRVCRLVRFQKPWRETMQEIRRTVGHVPALIDAGGVGDPILEFLQAGTLPLVQHVPAQHPGATLHEAMRVAQEQHAAHVVRQLRDAQQAAGLLIQAIPNLTGHVFTGANRQLMLEAIEVEVKRRTTLRIPGAPDGPDSGNPDHVLQLELEQFEYQHTKRGVVYNSPEGVPDDCVLALALALEHWRGAVRQAYAGAAAVAL